MDNLKINLLVGARFNGKIVSDAYYDLDMDADIYTSSPSRNWQNAASPRKRKVHFVPLISGLYERLTGTAPSRTHKDFSAVAFDAMASVRMRPCDVLHFWATFGLISATRQKRRGGKAVLDRACPHIHFQEELLAEEADRLGFKFARSSAKIIDRCIGEYEIADRIIVPSAYSYRTFVERGVPAEKMEIIRLDSNFSPKRKRVAKDPGQEFVVGCVGGSFLRKGIVYLVDAWQKLKLPNARLLLKTPAAELMRHAETWKRISSDSSIEVVERLRDMEDFYERCELFCLPSTDDGFGMVVLEAIACGVPVIVTENVGAADLVQEGKTGYIVKARQTDPLAERIASLHADRAMLAQMAENCLAFYKEFQRHSNTYKPDLQKLLRSLFMPSPSGTRLQPRGAQPNLIPT